VKIQKSPGSQRSGLPKTRSGKIMRRVLRAQEWGEEIGDISTLEND
jgi:acetyl-CoA synthetase